VVGTNKSETDAITSELGFVQSCSRCSVIGLDPGEEESTHSQSLTAVRPVISDSHTAYGFVFSRLFVGWGRSYPLVRLRALANHGANWLRGQDASACDIARD